MGKLMTPTPAQIREARESAGLSQTAAAELVHCVRKTWTQWEAEKDSPIHRGINLAAWELFLIKTNQHEKFHQPG